MSICRDTNDRRAAVRRMAGRNGPDFVEVLPGQKTLNVTFLGKLPPELAEQRPGNERYLRVEGGARVTDLRVTSVQAVVDPDPERDDLLVVKLDRAGDYSTYVLRLVDVAGIDPRYDRLEFSFKIDCPSDLDCAPACDCEPDVFPAPELDYLAKDYASFRRLILDRLSVVSPDWRERHVPDVGVALVEILAYVGDYLSYTQDAVATEAYLDTARKRVSVRRHVRLVDYVLHEGCNARAWVAVEVSADQGLEGDDVAFVTGLNDALTSPRSVLSWEDLREEPSSAYEVFKPVLLGEESMIRLRRAHNEIGIYTWGERDCCVARGATSTTLLDAWSDAEGASRALQLASGDVLVFEEVRGPGTGLVADADPTRRHAVRLTRVTPGEDPIYQSEGGRPTPIVDVEWSYEDALPFALCVSAITAAPSCRLVENVSVARGNVVLVDHGRPIEDEDVGHVGAESSEAACVCVDEPGDVEVMAERFRTRLSRTGLTYCEPLPTGSRRTSAAALLTQDPRAALPHLQLTSEPAGPWACRYDLLGSGPEDRHVVVEIDDEGVANLRFGDGELGFRPAAGTTFEATYRVGNGASGNVGPESISRLVLTNTKLPDLTVRVRNPLAASGGTDAEPLAEAKLFAPHTFRTRIERAVTADDYAEIAGRDARFQRAAAELVWTGSWYEAVVAVDPVGSEAPDDSLLGATACGLERYRRIGHELSVVPARYVPIELALEVCALPHYQRAHVKAGLLDAFGTRVLAGGRRGFFHPDNLTFGEGLALSRIVATTQAVAGVECVTVTALNRLFEGPNGEIAAGVLPLGAGEIARLDNDPNYPERGKLTIVVRGGR